MAATVRFGLLVAMFQAMTRDRTSAKKRGRLRTFLDRAYGASGRDDYFSALRLILPSLDRERGSYGLKEAALAAALVEALGIAKDSPDAVRLTNWRRGGGGRNAGNFSLVAAEVLQRRQGMTSGGLTIKECLQMIIVTPKDFARHKFPEEIDSYADFYYWDIDVSDLKQASAMAFKQVFCALREVFPQAKAQRNAAPVLELVIGLFG
ncbi:Putative DNA ligase 4 [Triticum urartu]|uniref:Putative DNA ligase 4 n=1 Tax=Triticum urartu TaxID=4572 RepID=M7ZMH0_TRIUA|nr:Putative DNA ligase 4 [Triticum urartu]